MPWHFPLLHRFCFALLAAALAMGCCLPEPAHSERPVPALAAASPGNGQPIFSQTGIASWYGRRHQGRLTASGQPFDASSLTAAHRTLPFGTILRVTDLKTKRVVKVRVNDRGPYVRGRVIDLSRAAGKALGMTRSGTAPVRIEVFASDQTKPRLDIAANGRRRTVID